MASDDHVKVVTAIDSAGFNPSGSLERRLRKVYRSHGLAPNKKEISKLLYSEPKISNRSHPYLVEAVEYLIEDGNCDVDNLDITEIPACTVKTAYIELEGLRETLH